jgi:hypothetical protein
MPKIKCTMLFLLGFLCCVISANADNQKGTIKSGRPIYRVKEQDEWNKKGRILGITKKDIAFKITIHDAAKKIVKAAEVEMHKKGKTAYEVWLTPGTYTMKISAKGYKTLDLKNLLVKKGNDLRIDLEFIKAE